VKKELKLSASLEDYLEVIYDIVRHKQAARAKDIADRLHVRAPSVTGALRLLSEKGLINYAPYDIITMTRDGERIARDVTRRHEALKTFFTKILCVDEQEAGDIACRLEHEISPNILKRLKKIVDFIDQCPRAGWQWINEFDSFCRAGKTGEGCEDCIRDCLAEYHKKKPE